VILEIKTATKYHTEKSLSILIISQNRFNKLFRIGQIGRICNVCYLSPVVSYSCYVFYIAVY